MSEARQQLADSATRIYGIIGDPIAQAKSPAVFNEKFRALGRNAAMIPLHAKPENFDVCVRGLKSLANLDGLLVTLPFKTGIIAHADTVLPAARRIGAMNALRREPDGTWSGDMFDGKGFVGGLRASGLDPKGRSIMLIGAGGAGGAIADALAEAGASTIAIFDCGEGRAQDLACRIAQAHPGCHVCARAPTVEGVDVLINATPVGMAPGDGLPAAFGPFSDKLFVADIVPRRDTTPLIALARRSGCQTMEGQAMVTGQADAILRFFGLLWSGFRPI
jgi:shikimate dehydrogenase